MRRNLQLVITLALIVTSLVTFAEPAHACSCNSAPGPRGIAQSANPMLRVNELSRRTESCDTRTVIATVEVIEAFRGDVPAVLEIEVGQERMSCGIWPTLTPESVVLPSPLNGPRYRLGPCGGDRLSIDDVERLFATPPAPTGTGPPRWLVAGWLGNASVAVLDAELKPLAFGSGVEPTIGVAPCPQGRVAVEVQRDGSATEATLVVRDLATLAEGLRRPLGEVLFEGLTCLDASGDRVAFSLRGGLALVSGTAPPTYVHLDLADAVIAPTADRFLAATRTGTIVLGSLAPAQTLAQTAPAEGFAVHVGLSNDAATAVVAVGPSVLEANPVPLAVSHVLIGPPEGPWTPVADAPSGELHALGASGATGFAGTIGDTMFELSNAGIITNRTRVRIEPRNLFDPHPNSALPINHGKLHGPGGPVDVGGFYAAGAASLEDAPQPVVVNPPGPTLVRDGRILPETTVQTDPAGPARPGRSSWTRGASALVAVGIAVCAAVAWRAIWLRRLKRR